MAGAMIISVCCISVRVRAPTLPIEVRSAPASELKNVAVQGGMKTLREDGALKVLAGLTTIDEVMRVTAED